MVTGVALYPSPARAFIVIARRFHHFSLFVDLRRLGDVLT